MDNNNQPQQPFQPAPGPAPQPVMPPQPALQQPQPFQPVSQPVQPQQPFGAPVGPVGPAPTGAPYQMPPKKGLSKGALWGIIGGSIAFVLLIVGVILAVVFLGGPSRDDYLALQSQIKDIKEQRKKISKVLLPHANAVFNGRQSNGDLKEALGQYTVGVDKLKDLSALKDKEVKESYDALLEEAAAVKIYAQAFVDAEEPSLAAYKKCDGSLQVAAMRISNPRARIVALRDASRECGDAMGKMTDSKAEKIAAYAKAAQKAYDSQVAIFNDIVKAIDSRDQAAYYSAQRRLQSQGNDFLKIQGNLAEVFTDTKKHDKMPRLNALEDLVAEKLKK